MKQQKRLYKIIDYYKNGNKRWEIEYQNNKELCKETHWLANGDKFCEKEYQDGKEIK